MHHLYRAMAFLGEELADQTGATDFTPRCNKELIEEGERGFSKDHRPDLKQMVVGLVINDEGRPICCEMWPGILWHSNCSLIVSTKLNTTLK